MSCRHYELPGVDDIHCPHCDVYLLYNRPTECRPPTAEYLAAKAQLKVCDSNGEVDPRRLHGPELARWQVDEARRTRGNDLDAWLSATRRAPHGAASPG